MGIRRNRRSRRLETPSPERSTDRIQVETPNTGIITLTNPDTVVQEGLGEGNSREQLVEPSQVSNEIQAWTEIFEQKNNDRITKMREEMENKLDAILMEIKTSKSTSLTTNPRSEMNEIESMQPSGSKGKKSMVVNASDNESIDSENEDIPLKASEMRDLRHPAKPIHQNDTTLDATVIFNEESDEEDYHMVKQLCINIKTVFECIRNAGLKLSMSKCHFGVKQVDFLGRTITPDGVAPQADKVKDFLAKLRFPKSKKALQRYIGFLNYYRNYIPRLSERLTPFFKLLKETSKFYVPTNLVEDFTNLNQLLENSCQLALKQPLKDKQLIVMSDASFTAAGYAIMIEDGSQSEASIQTKNLRTHCVWIKNVQSNTNENVNLCKRIPLNIFCIRRVWTPHVGEYLPCHRVHG